MTERSNTPEDDGYPYRLSMGDVVDKDGRRYTVAGNKGIAQLLNERAELRRELRAMTLRCRAADRTANAALAAQSEIGFRNAAARDASVPSGATGKAGDRPLSPAPTAPSDDKLHADTPRTNAHLSHLNLPDGRKVGIPDQTMALLRELERQSAGAVTKVMVDRFLSWRLPKDFSPDNGISFKPIDHPHGLTHLWPTGTNLLNADQAKAMLEHVLAVVQSAVAASLDVDLGPYDAISSLKGARYKLIVPGDQPFMAKVIAEVPDLEMARKIIAALRAPRSAIGAPIPTKIKSEGLQATDSGSAKP